MITAKDLRRMLAVVPDDAVIIINNNYNVSVESLDVTMTTFTVCDIVLTGGYSITKDSVINEIFDQLRDMGSHG